MKEIPLSQGYKALVDDSDFEHVNQFKMKGVYAAKAEGYHFQPV
jgi:hypothetical protein